MFKALSISGLISSQAAAFPAKGRIQGRAIGAIFPPKNYGSNFIHHDFVQFRKQHTRCKTILPSTVLLQQNCEVHVISSTIENP